MKIRRRLKKRVPAGAQESEIWKTIFSAAYRRVPAKRILAAVLLTIFIHIFVYFTAPETLAILVEITPAPQVEITKPEDLAVPEELLPEEFRKKDRPEFVPVNPEAPSAIPNKTNLHAAADQRAAQPNPDPTTRSRTPKNDGELENSRGIAQNVLPRELLPPELRSMQTAPRGKASEEKKSAETETKKEPGVQANEGETGTVSLGETTEEPKKEPDGVPDPQERPRIAPPPGLNTLTMKSNMTTNEIGAVSLDAKYSEFGDYTQRMLEAIQAAWYVRVESGSITHRRGVVRVQFTLCSDGTIKDSRILESSAPEAAAYACLDAVESRAPFEIWPQEMIEIVGTEQTSVIAFYYR